ncbi:MAG: hypothetical protein NTV88_00445 [Candidatus Micrarchaeota archaeon]|nr:hypothetical protein [Candidatus Micrarchaeota archaeon]
MAKKKTKIAKRKTPSPKKPKKAISKSKKRITPPKVKVKHETFALDIGTIGQPEHPFAQARMAPEEQAYTLRPEAFRTIQHKKRIPHAFTALIMGAVLALFSAWVFLGILDVGEILAYSVSSAIFVGFSILLYSKLEMSQGR